MKLFRKVPHDLKTALGQILWIGVNGTTADDPATIEIFDEFQPGGVVLFQRNVESMQQVQRMNSALQKKSSVPLFIAIDQEGGTVERLHAAIGGVPPAMALAAARNRRLIRYVHTTHARILRALGFNVNFTPVLDLACTHTDNGLGTRCFSDDPKIVARCAIEVIKAHEASSVLISGKHFPGLGDTDCDSHLDLPVVPRSWRRLQKEDLVPYKKLLPHLPFIMINHALYPDRNKQLPASLAPEIVKEFLLGDWNYGGLSITDDLFMGAVSKLYNLPEAIEMGLLAGNHMALICKPDGVLHAYKRVLKRAQTDHHLREAIFRASSNVFALKMRTLHDTSGRESLPKLVKQLRKYGTLTANRSVTWLAGRPLSAMPGKITAFLPRNKWLNENQTELTDFFKTHGVELKQIFYQHQMSEKEALEAASQSATPANLVVTVDHDLRPGQQALMRELVRNQKEVLIITGAFPSRTIPEGVRAAVSTYWTWPGAIIAGTRVLTGQSRPTGRLPLAARTRSRA